MLCDECLFLSIAKDKTVNKLMMIYFQSKTMYMIIYHSREQTREMCSILILIHSLFFYFNVNELYI